VAKVVETNVPKDIELTIKLNVEEIGVLTRAMGRHVEGYELFRFFDRLYEQYR